VVEHREERSDEDDGWKDLKSKDEAQAGVGLAEIAEHEGRANIGEIEEVFGAIAKRLENVSAGRDAENEDTKNNLEAKPPGDGFQLDGFAARGENPGKAKHHEQTEYPGEASHSLTSFHAADRG
jgi:hypothetical protein